MTTFNANNATEDEENKHRGREHVPVSSLVLTPNGNLVLNTSGIDVMTNSYPPDLRQQKQRASSAALSCSTDGEAGEDDEDSESSSEEEDQDDEEEQEMTDFDDDDEEDDDDRDEDEIEVNEPKASNLSESKVPLSAFETVSLRTLLEEQQQASKPADIVSNSQYQQPNDLPKSKVRPTRPYSRAGGAVFIPTGKPLVIKSPVVPSIFDDGDEVLYFPQEHEQVGKLPPGLSATLKWKICKFTPTVVRNCLRRTHFKLVKGGKKWVGYWGKHFHAERFKSVQPWQKVNHFPMSFEIGRKDRLYVNVKRLQECVGGQEMNYMPDTYFLPNHRRRLKRVFDSHPLWIIKPPASARGQGIKVVNKWSKLPRKKEVIVSKYVHKPYLIDGKKFDLRLYVVVTSFEPLRLYLYKEGIVRFAADRYSSSTNSKNVKNRYCHLTNYSVSRKKNKPKVETPYQSKLDPRFSTESSKWSLDLLWEYLNLQGVDVYPLMQRIKKLVTSSVISVHSANANGMRLYVPNSGSCYELFGFDVLLDKDLKPWLMEVNISPSLKASSDSDYALKSRLVSDIFNMIGVRIKDLEMSAKMKKKQHWKKPALSSSERQKHKDFNFRTEKAHNILESLNDDDIRQLKIAEDEFHRRGNFERLAPAIDADNYLSFFPTVPYYDELLYQWCKLNSTNPEKAYNILLKRNTSKKSSVVIPNSTRSSLLALSNRSSQSEKTNKSSSLRSSLHSANVRSPSILSNSTGTSLSNRSSLTSAAVSTSSRDRQFTYPKIVPGNKPSTPAQGAEISSWGFTSTDISSYDAASITSSSSSVMNASNIPKIARGLENNPRMKALNQMAQELKVRSTGPSSWERETQVKNSRSSAGSKLPYVVYQGIEQENTISDWEKRNSLGSSRDSMIVGRKLVPENLQTPTHFASRRVSAIVGKRYQPNSERLF
ncbi:Tubulin polyglutamylase ttll4 [Chytridiales sp. JEL 0842]|nr:Tubulin polyglutamylase ttll4 [Chytridiales sp. JEL 0842]